MPGQQHKLDNFSEVLDAQGWRVDQLDEEITDDKDEDEAADAYIKLSRIYFVFSFLFFSDCEHVFLPCIHAHPSTAHEPKTLPPSVSAHCTLSTICSRLLRVNSVPLIPYQEPRLT